MCLKRIYFLFSLSRPAITFFSERVIVSNRRKVAILHFNKWVAPDELHTDMDRKIVV